MRLRSLLLNKKFRLSCVGGLLVIAVVVLTNPRQAKDYVAFIASHVVPLEKLRLSSDNYASELANCKQRAKSTKQGGIVLLGDSLTAGLGLGTIWADVVNLGIDGDTTAGILDRYPETVEPCEPKTIVLMIGYNDLKFRKDASILENIEKILEQSSSSRVYLQSVLPIDSRRKWYNKRIVRINKQLKDLANKSSHVTFVDLYGLFIDESQNGIKKPLTRDGVHLSSEGYRVWWDRLGELLHTPSRQ